MIDILGADWRFFWPENIHFFSGTPQAWDASLNSGLGISGLATMWITSYLNITAVFAKIGIPWLVVGIFFWILPIFIVSFIASALLFKKTVLAEKKYYLFSGLVYAWNTYILGIVGGGQLGVGLSYSILPLIFLSFYFLHKKPNFTRSILFSLVCSLQILFDPRFFYISLIGLIVFYFGICNKLRINLRNVIFIIIVPVVIIFVFHAYWLIPLLLATSSSLPEKISTQSSLTFLSFARFPQAISLLHPNWPENIFGKVYFFQPQFLFSPILLAVGLFLQKKNSRIFLSYILLIVIGVFISKGVNEPFGVINVILFHHIPGMVLFRDPTKFYILTAISYAMLLPFTMQQLSPWLKKKKTFIVLLIVSFWVLLPFSTFYLGNGFENFVPKKIPEKYVLLKNFLLSTKGFSRTYWVPEWEKYGYFSNKTPALGMSEFFDKKDVKINQQSILPTRDDLANLSVKYVILSKNDSSLKTNPAREILQYEENRKYLDSTPWLRHVASFDDLRVYRFSDGKAHFWSDNKDLLIRTISASQSEHKLFVSNVKKESTIIFTETYDPNWEMVVNGISFRSSPYKNQYNKFTLNKEGNYEIVISYRLQNVVQKTIIVSNSIIFLLFLYVVLSLRLPKLKIRS